VTKHLYFVGVVLAKKWLFRNSVPDRVGGGTVQFVRLLFYLFPYLNILIMIFFNFENILLTVDIIKKWFRKHNPLTKEMDRLNKRSRSSIQIIQNMLYE